MMNFPKSPWDFAKNYDKFYSPDMNMWIEYADLHEVNQGGPLAGDMALLYSDKGAIVSDWAGGPPVWETRGRKLAFPLWKATLFKGRFQRLVVVDTEAETITVFAERFRVLRLEKFDNNLIWGQDSPIHDTKEICFDILSSKVKKSMQYHLEEMRVFPDK